MFDLWFHTKIRWIFFKKKQHKLCSSGDCPLEDSTGLGNNYWQLFTYEYKFIWIFFFCIYSSLNILYLALYENDVYNKIYFLAWSFVQTSGAYPGLIPLQTHCKKELVQKQTLSLSHTDKHQTDASKIKTPRLLQFPTLFSIGYNQLCALYVSISTNETHGHWRAWF